MKEQRAHISIGRVRGNPDPKEPIRIEVREGDRFYVMFEIRMTLEEFANCLVGNSEATCVVTRYPKETKI